MAPLITGERVALDNRGKGVVTAFAEDGVRPLVQIYKFIGSLAAL